MRKTFVFDLAVSATEALRVATEAGDAVADWRRDPSRERTWKFGSHLGLRGTGRATIAVAGTDDGRSQLSVQVRRWGLMDIFGLLRREARLLHEQVAPRVQAAAEAGNLAPPAIRPERIERARVGLRLLALFGVILGLGAVLSLIMVLGAGDGEDGGLVEVTVAEAPSPGAADDAVSCALQIGGSITGGATGVPLPEVTGCDAGGEQVTVPVPGRATIVWVATAWDPHSEIQAGVVREWLTSVSLGDTALVVVVGGLDRAPDGLPAWAAESFPGMVTIVVPGSEVSDAYGVTGFPEWFVVGADGILTDRVVGRIEAGALDALLVGG